MSTHPGGESQDYPAKPIPPIQELSFVTRRVQAMEAEKNKPAECSLNPTKQAAQPPSRPTSPSKPTSRKQQGNYSAAGGHGCNECGGGTEANRDELSSATRKIARLKAKLQAHKEEILRLSALVDSVSLDTIQKLETELAVERRNHEDKRRRLKRRGKEAETARRRLQQENALLNEQLAARKTRAPIAEAAPVDSLDIIALKDALEVQSLNLEDMQRRLEQQTKEAEEAHEHLQRDNTQFHEQLAERRARSPGPADALQDNPDIMALEDALEVERFNLEAMQRRLEQQTKEAEEAHEHLQRENTQLNEQLAAKRTHALGTAGVPQGRPDIIALEDALEVERFKREAMQRRLDQQTKEAEEAHKHLQRENTLLNEQLAARRARGAGAAGDSKDSPDIIGLEDALEVERFNREAMQRRLDQQTREAEEAHKHLQRENTQLNEQLATLRGPTE